MASRPDRPVLPTSRWPHREPRTSSRVRPERSPTSTTSARRSERRRSSSFGCRVYRTDPVPATLPTFSGCGSGQQGYWTTTDLTNGDYRLEVRGQDVNPDARAVTSTDFTVARPLTTTWVARPAGTIAGTSFAAAFTAPGATRFECRVDSSPTWGGCGSGQQGYYTGSLSAGSHSLGVRAVSGSDTGPEATTAFTLQPLTGTSQDVTVSGPAEGSTIPSAWAAFSWSAPAASCYDYRYIAPGAEPAPDDGWSGCSSWTTETQTGLTDGIWKLQVRARSTGNVLGPITTRTFTVDTTPATTVTVLGPAEGSTIPSAWAAFSWSAPAASCYDYRYIAPGADPAPDAGWSGCSSWTTETQTGLTDGIWKLQVRARSTGNVLGPITTRTFTVDTTPATTVTVLGPAEGSTIPSAWAAFSWSAPAASCYDYRYIAPGADPAPDAGWSGCSSWTTETQTGLTDGIWKLQVRARSTGNVLGPITTRTFTVDTTPATTVTVLGPAEGSTIPSAWAAFSWSAPAASCYDYRYIAPGADPAPDAGWSGCSSWTTETQTGLTDGIWKLQVRARSTGNVLGPITTRTFTVKSGPWVTVWSRPRTVLPVGTVAFSWSAPAASCYDYRYIAPGADPAPDAGWSGCSSWTTETQTGLTDGIWKLQVRARSTGNVLGPVTTQAFTVETNAPQTVLTSTPPAFSASTSATFEFTADEPATFTCQVDQLTPVPCEPPWTRSGLAQGSHHVQVWATDLSGNVDDTPAEYEWDVDTVAPVIIELTGPAPVVTTSGATLSYLADGPASYQCRLSPATQFTSCGAGGTAAQTYPDLPDGSYTFDVRAVDRAGNVGPTRAHTWTVVTEAPETVITNAPSALSRQTTARVEFTSPDNPVTFQCRLDTASFAPCTSALDLTGLGQGQHNLLVRAVKAGVLADPTPATATWTVDSVAPITTITAGPSGVAATGELARSPSPRTRPM